MILSDGAIRERVERGALRVDPMPTDTQYQPASLDLRLGRECYDVVVGERTRHAADDEITIRPGSFYLCHTAETVRLPRDLSAMVSGRSTFGREGIIVHATAGWIDPGFSGEITLEVFNFNHEPVALPVGERVCQLVFLPLDQPAERPYGTERDSQYQGQEGAVPSRRA